MSQGHEYRFGEFVVAPETWQLTRGGQEVHVEPTVLKLLIYLLENREHLVSKDELLEAVWGRTLVSESALSKAVARLRKVLADDPAHPRYIETAHSMGYRFIADVEKIGADEKAPKPASNSRRAATWVLVIAGILTIGAWLFRMDLAPRWSDEEASAESRRFSSLAVLPLDNLTGDAGQDYFVEGLHEVLITDLSKISGLRVISRQSSMRYQGSDKTAPEIASELNVDVLVEGGVLQGGQQVRVIAQLIDGRTDEHIWAATFDRDMQDVLALLSDVARSISDEIEIELLPREREHLAGTGPSNPDAIDAYLKGRYALRKFRPESFQIALQYFHEAVEIDPDFTLAWAGMAAAHLMNAYFGNGPPGKSVMAAETAAVKCLQLDAQSFAGHAVLGWVRLFSWDWVGAGEAFEIALELNPNDATTYHGYADYLTVTGRPEEGLAQVMRGQSLDPFSAMASVPVVFHLYMMRRYNDAVEEAQELLQMNPGLPVHLPLMMTYWKQEKYEDAITQYRKALNRWRDQELLAALEKGYIEAGPRGALLSVADEMAARADSGYVDPFRIASNYALAGNSSAALMWLEAAVDQHSLELVYITVRPEFDFLRNNARYRELLKRLGL